MPVSPPDIEAEIHFFLTEEGGRERPCASGYRPNHDFGIEGMLNDAEHRYVDAERALPGNTVTAHLWFAKPEYQLGRLRQGFEFTVQEGARIVGRGRVTKIFNEALVSAET